jgi:hypothetical protein
MTTTTVQTVVAAAQELSPAEQLEIIQALTRVLQQRYMANIAQPAPVDAKEPTLPAGVHRTSPITSLSVFAADFWPDDETADDVNTYLAQQRAADRLRDIPDLA